jgi:hypothetical protein
VGQDGFWSRAWVVPLALAAVGGILALLSGNVDRLGYSYLFALFFVVTLMLGGMFLVLIQFLSAAHWGVTSRRIPEVFMSAAPVVALLALPFLVGVFAHKLTVYSEWQDVSGHGAEHSGEEKHDSHGDEQGAHEEKDEHGALSLGASVARAQGHGDEHAGAHGEEAHEHSPQEVALHHEILESKSAYLNNRGWLIRGLLYLFFWCLIGLAYFRWSREQDVDGDPAHTVRMQSLSPLALMLFGLTLTFAAFDWLMALEPAWYSTIFGVVIFAGSAVAIFAMTILIGLSFEKRGLTGDAINAQHFHDLGKMMFGFVCFWTYVQFSQWMLIWYAGIPEEATWYHKRWEGGWAFVSMLLILGHFVAPFVLLISRVQKLNFRWLQAMCFWLLFMHIVDIYWFVLPQAGSFGIQLVDVGAFLFVAGVFLAYVFWKLGQVPLVPMGDPRLARSLHHHQTH